MKNFGAATAGWFVAYLFVVFGVIAGMFSMRGCAIRTLDTPEARAEWQAFVQEEADKQASGTSPVKRRVPTSGEPPALVLMRDYFKVFTIMAVVLTSAVFATLALLMRGAIGWKS